MFSFYLIEDLHDYAVPLEWRRRFEYASEISDMRSAYILFFSFLSCLIFSVFIASAAAPDIILSEVQIEGSAGADEFVELYNQGAASASLGGWKLCRKTSTGSYSQVKSFSSGDTVPSDGFYLFANGDGIFATIADTVTKSSALAVNNSIALTDSCSATAPPTVILDSLAWGTGKPFDATTPLFGNPSANESLVRDRKTLEWSLSDTPTPTNSKGETIPEPDPTPPPDPIPDPTPASPSSSVRLNELFPNPKDEDDEWIEIYNAGPDQAMLDGWVLEDAAKTKYVFPSKTTLGGGSYLVIGKALSKISLNNTSETVTLLDAGGRTVDTVSYTTTIEEESYNSSSSGWRWSKTRTPGASNSLNNLPSRKRTEIPKDVYVNVYADFSARGSDADGDALKYVWDFGDDHKSYVQTTRHKYEKEGTYHGTLTMNDGSESTVKEFTIKVEKFPDRKIRIAALSANPSGADTGAEWILLVNKDKRKIDLLGWSIATGTKKKTLTNHPVNEHFILKPGESKQLKSPISLFTLPNERGTVELRMPNGKVVQTVQYRADGGIAKDTVYAKKDGGGWEWTRNNQQITVNSQQITDNNQQSTDSSQQLTVNEEQPTLNNQDQKSEILNQQSTIPPGGMSVIEEHRRERRLAEIIRKESRVDTPTEILSAPPHILGATIDTSPAIPADTTSSETLFETINEALNSLTH